jgi:hypothetical protein
MEEILVLAIALLSFGFGFLLRGELQHFRKQKKGAQEE